VYGEVKAMGVSAQPALHAVRKTADATLKANLKAGTTAGSRVSRPTPTTASPSSS